MIAIVGAGAAGVSAAVTLGQLGVDEDIRLIGAEPVVPYERPALSKEFLTDPTRREPPPLEADGLDRYGVSLEIDTHVVSIDPAEQTLDTGTGERLRYESLLLATGSRPRRLSVPGADLAGVSYLREFKEARQLRGALSSARRIAIVGGGVIGLEVAASALALGCAVTVIEIESQLMGRIVPKPLSDAVAALRGSCGVEILTDTRAVAIEGNLGRVEAVQLHDGRRLPTDLVLVGIGAEPRTELALGAKIETDNGILVDDHFRTSANRVFAAGDVARVHHAMEGRRMRLEQWQTAQAQGRHAAMSIFGSAEPYRDIPWMWSDQHGVHIQAAGFGFDSVEVICRGNLDDRDGLAFFALRDERLVAVGGLSRGAGIARTIRPAQQLIQHQTPVTVEQIENPDTSIRELARHLER